MASERSLVKRFVVGLLLVIVLLVVSGPVMATEDSNTGPTISGLGPADVDHGDTKQMIRIGGQAPAGTSEMTIDITPLSEAGVDLSNASVAVNRSLGSMQVDPTIDRSGEGTTLRIEFDAETETSFRLALQLRQLNTSTADQTWVRYEASAGDQDIQSNRFRIESPDMPGVGIGIDSDSLIVGQSEETQQLRVSVFDAPPDTPVTITVDIRSLREANVSLADLETDARVLEGDAVLQEVTRSDGTITLDARITGGERASFELDLTELDTSGAMTTDELRYPVTLEAPAGSKTIESGAFGIYPPGENPTPTETIWESPTQTETSTAPAPTDTAAPGTPPWATGIAVIAAIALGLLRRRRSES